MKTPTLTRHALTLAMLVLAGGVAATATPAAFAQDSGTATEAAAPALPAWDQLTAAQRELLVAPLRERWNARPEARARMLSHAQRWQEMTPEQRQRARHGMHRWEKMDPEHRERMRVLFDQMRGMNAEQRKALRKQWHEMTPEQRKAWVERNAARQSD